MLQTTTPIGKVIFLSYQASGGLKDDGVLQNNLEQLIVVLKHHVSKKGLEEAQVVIEDQLFSLRFDILEYLLKHPDFLEKMENSIVDEIGAKYFSKGKYKELNRTVSDTLEVYLLMFGKMTEGIAGNISALSPVPENIKKELTLSMLRHAYFLQPNPELKNVIEWFSASVKYDFYLIVAELLLSGELLLEEEEVYSLIRLLKKSIVDFGTYTVLSGIWVPMPEDETQLIRNIKIKAAALSLNMGQGNIVSVDTLSNMMHLQ